MTVEMVVGGLAAWALLSVVVGVAVGRWLKGCARLAEATPAPRTPPLIFRKSA
jgi:hypothetical protein